MLTVSPSLVSSAATQLCCDHQEVQLPAGEDGHVDAEVTERPEGLHPGTGHPAGHRDPQQVREGHRLRAGQSRTGTAGQTQESVLFLTA